MENEEIMNIGEIASEQEEIEIIGVTFRSAGKIYYFDANNIKAGDGKHVIVDTARGYEYGKVALSNRMMNKNEIVQPLRKVMRVADKNDDLRYKANCEKEDEAFEICLKKIQEHKLDMKLIDVEYTFDNAKLLFYFTSEERVDFRELVKDLASVFRTRIELRQIGLRDETKIIGGFGICGREFCCHSFLGDFVQVSIKMAKEQNLSLNSAKISGVCGRLMCCLRYEHETYQEELKKTPKVDSAVITPDGPGIVVDAQPLSGLVKVRLDKDPEGTPVVYDRGVLKNTNGEFIAPGESPAAISKEETFELPETEESRPEKAAEPQKERNNKGNNQRKKKKNQSNAPKAPASSDKAKPQTNQKPKTNDNEKLHPEAERAEKEAEKSAENVVKNRRKPQKYRKNHWQKNKGGERQNKEK